MKNFILLPALLLGINLFLSGCYTYLSLSTGAEFAEIPYEPNFPPDPGPPPPPPPPPPRPEPIIRPHIPPSPPYERPDGVIDIRNGGGERNSNSTGRRR